MQLRVRSIVEKIEQQEEDSLSRSNKVAEFYNRHFLPPTSLQIFSDAAVMTMEFGDLGTVLNVIHAIQKRKVNLNVEEHELLVAMITHQVKCASMASSLASSLRLDWCSLVRCWSL